MPSRADKLDERSRETIERLAQEIAELTGRNFEEEPATGIVLTFTHLSGGVGKTTTNFNLGYELALKGKRVLLVDLDPQSDLSMRVDVTPRFPSLARVLSEGEGIPNPIPIRWGEVTVWMLPSTLEGMAGIELNLLSQNKTDQRLARALKWLLTMFDYILIDCPPNLSLVSKNGIVATEGLIGGIIIPVQAQDKAYRALMVTLKSLAKMNRDFDLCIVGILATMTASSGMEREIKEQITSRFASLSFHTSIPKRVRMAVDGRYQAPIGHYDYNSDGAKAHRQLADEVIERTQPDEDGKPSARFRLLERETATLLEAYDDEKGVDYGEVEGEGVIDRG